MGQRSLLVECSGNPGPATPGVPVHPRRMIWVMDEPQATEEAGTEPGGRDWGRALDAAGVIAGVLLLVIVADIWSDGRLVSRRLLRGGGEDKPGDPAAD